jgi:hypothetical protein
MPPTLAWLVPDSTGESPPDTRWIHKKLLMVIDWRLAIFAKFYPKKYYAKTTMISILE